MQKSGRFGWSDDIVASPKRKRGRRSFKLEVSDQNIYKSISLNRIGPLPKEIPEVVNNPLLFAD